MLPRRPPLPLVGLLGCSCWQPTRRRRMRPPRRRTSLLGCFGMVGVGCVDQVLGFEGMVLGRFVLVVEDELNQTWSLSVC